MNSLPSSVPCLVCQGPLSLRLARGRKSGKPFLMLVCPRDGRHFRGFVNDQAYVAGVLERLEAQDPDDSGPAADAG
ncbi:MAG: hypothetical protein ACE5Q6_16295 [Dehalococcoidia bacterium]